MSKWDDAMWRDGADSLASMACSLADELRYEYDEENDEFTVFYETYDMSRTEAELWRALWVLERDVRSEHGWSAKVAFGRPPEEWRD